MRQISKPYFLIILLAVLPGLMQCSSKKDAEKEAGHNHATAEEYYTCPMHPSVRSDRPGVCPVCNMTLVKVSGSTGKGQAENTITLTDRERQLANIKTITAGSGSVGGAAILTGEVVFNENATEVLTARLPGRIDRLYIRSEGETISKGQPLYEIYSEQLAAAQQEYLLALRQSGGEFGSELPNLSEASRQKLRLWGMTEKQLNQLARTGKAKARLTVYSPASGTVVEIGAREGSYVAEGSTIVRVADLSTIWVQAQLYPQEAGLVKENDTVKIVAEAFPKDTLTGQLVLNNPALEQNRQLNLATFKVPNPGQKLKPGMMAYVLAGEAKSGTITVPKSAIIPGEMPVVWVETEAGVFQPRMVKLGDEGKEQVVVLDGVHDGEKVVVQGVYLLNSEYTLKRGAGAVHQH